MAVPKGMIHLIEETSLERGLGGGSTPQETN